MSTRNICHRTSRSTTKQFHIHKNTNNKDICDTKQIIRDPILLQLYDVLYVVSYRILFGRGGWGSECTSPGPASSPSSLEDFAPVASSASSSKSVGDCIHIWS